MGHHDPKLARAAARIISSSKGPKPERSRPDQLAAHYIREFGVVGIAAEKTPVGTFCISFVQRVPLTLPPDTRMLCAVVERTAVAIALKAEKALRPPCPPIADLDGAVSVILDAAASFRLPLTPHAVVVARAREAVAAMEQRFEGMKAAGELKALSAVYKRRRMSISAASNEGAKRDNPTLEFSGPDRRDTSQAQPRAGTTGDKTPKCPPVSPGWSAFVHRFKLDLLAAMAAEARRRTGLSTGSYVQLR